MRLSSHRLIDPELEDTVGLFEISLRPHRHRKTELTPLGV